MKPFRSSAALIVFSAALWCRAPSPSFGRQSPSDPSRKPAPESSAPAPAPAGTPAPAAADQDKTKKKPKKVWTNDELSTVSGGISVVGDTNAASAPPSKKSAGTDSHDEGSAKDKQVASYRDQLQQLRAQLDATDKKINDTRNFKADNTSATGGINMNKGYSMTPVEDQIKQLEAQRKQIQDKIEAVEDEARKNGIEPGQLR
jgi:hypothetical protein